jgi:hypothetical protein
MTSAYRTGEFVIMVTNDGSSLKGTVIGYTSKTLDKPATVTIEGPCYIATVNVPDIVLCRTKIF